MPIHLFKFKHLEKKCLKLLVIFLFDLKFISFWIIIYFKILTESAEQSDFHIILGSYIKAFLNKSNSTIDSYQFRKSVNDHGKLQGNIQSDGCYVQNKQQDILNFFSDWIENFASLSFRNSFKFEVINILQYYKITN